MWNETEIKKAEN